MPCTGVKFRLANKERDIPERSVVQFSEDVFRMDYSVERFGIHYPVAEL
jgi:hypothetical protein